jgi:ubiquinone/menaquinone biosynthesis C-methylase UbiE
MASNINSMNGIHRTICASRWWGRGVERELVPWCLDGVELGESVLEVGPGFGATTRVLARRPGSLTAIELEERYCRRLRRELGDSATIVQGDATELAFPDNSFSGAVCFTMLHHVPSRELQDRLLSEVSRVLRPGGTFAGTDSLGHGLLFKAIHLGDTLVQVDPADLPERLERAGLSEVHVDTSPRSLRFRARKL